MKEFVYPEPIRPSEIGYRDLSPVPPELGEKPHVLIDNPVARFKAGVDPAWYQEEFTYQGRDYFNEREWDDTWRQIPYARLAGIFTFEELTRMWVGSFIQSHVSEHMKEHEPFLWKISNVLWQQSYVHNYNRILDVLQGLRRLAFDQPGFEIRLTHTRHFNLVGHAEHVADLWLDAPWGILLYYRGEHVLTVAFSTAREGVLITQVQLRKKKGNRFLYHLGAHYLDVAVDILTRAFPDQPMWLVDGASAVAAVRRAYGKTPCGMTPDDEKRIQGLYDRPLAAYVRTPTAEEYVRQGRKYMRIVPQELARAA